LESEKGKKMRESKKKVLLINPSVVGEYSHSMVRYKVNFSPQLAIAILSSIAEKAGFEVFISDLNIESIKQLEDKIKKTSPDFIGITFSTSQYLEIPRIISLSRKFSNAKIILGGPHVSAMPKQSFKELSPDIIVLGEGEKTFSQIISGKKPSLISGILFKENGKIRIISKNDECSIMDAIPFPDWRIFEIPKYIKGNTLIGRIESSRGCPFSCLFCDHSVFGYKINKKSPKRVVEDLIFLKKSGFKEAFFIDEIINLDNSNLKKICGLIIKNKVKMPWKVHGFRLDCLDYSSLSLMKKAGCLSLGVGIESGSDKVLGTMNKRERVDEIKKAISSINKAGIGVFGYFMIGFPGEDEEDIKKTIKFALSLPLKFAKVTFFTPSPGSAIFKNIKNGRIIAKDFSEYAYHKVAFLPDNLSEKLLHYYYNQFYLRFYFRPKQMMYLLIESFKERTLLYDITSLFKLIFGAKK
jgi:anaerobic magnesium-protoporphyrin IX monomethyl ester cyclase